MQIIGSHILMFEELESTNTNALDLLKTSNPIEGTVVRAIIQTGGRGQRGNTWLSDANSLCFSIILKPKFLAIQQQFVLNKAIALAVRNSLANYTNKEVLVKWPNDIYIENKKVAGILIENSLSSKGIEYSVVGIGVNVNQKKIDSSLNKATSLAIELNLELDLQTVFTNLLNTINAFYLQLRSGNTLFFEEEYMKYLYQYGQFCTYLYQNKKIEAKIVGVNLQGNIELEDLHGNLFQCGIKELVFL